MSSVCKYWSKYEDNIKFVILSNITSVAMESYAQAASSIFNLNFIMVFKLTNLKRTLNFDYHHIAALKCNS